MPLRRGDLFLNSFEVWLDFYLIANGERAFVRRFPIPCQTKCFGALKV